MFCTVKLWPGFSGSLTCGHIKITQSRGGGKTNSSINKSGQLKCNFETTKNKLTVI